MNAHTIHFNRTFVTVAIAGYIAIILLLGFLDSYMILNYQRDMVKKQRDIVRSEASRIENYLSNLKSYMDEKYLYDDDFAIISAYNKKDNLVTSRYEFMKRLENDLSIYNHISAFFIFYTGEEEVVYKYDKMQIADSDIPELKKILQSYHQAKPETSKNWFLADAEGNLCAVKSYTRENAELFGVFSLHTNLTYLLQQLPDGAELLLIDGDRSVYGNEEITESMQVTLASDYEETIRKGHLYLTQTIDGTDYQIIVSIPYRFRLFISTQQTLITILMFLGIFGIIWLIYFIRRQFLMPLRDLNTTMELIESGKLHHVPEKNYRLKEFDDINHTFGYMIQSLEDQKIATYEKTLDEQKARIQYLQLQIKPHFYLNGLKTVNAMAISGNTDEMQEYLQHLSGHLRYLLQIERDTVDISQELEFADNYVKLQSEMTGRNIQYTVLNDAPDIPFEVPVLCIQTFLENSIKYAKMGSVNAVLELRTEILHLNADGEEYLDITVRDNGQGYPKEVLHQINGEIIEDGTNIGINNLKRRLQLLYSDRVQLAFVNDHGAINEIIIPRGLNR